MTPTDTSIVLGLLRADDNRHNEVAGWYARHRSPLVTTPLVLAELDYLLGSPDATHDLYEQLRTGGLGATWWPEALDTTLKVVRRRPDVGLTDASLVALAAHLGTTRIATFDERHFRTLQPLTGEPAFTLLPADAD